MQGRMLANRGGTRTPVRAASPVAVRGSMSGNAHARALYDSQEKSPRSGGGAAAAAAAAGGSTSFSTRVQQVIALVLVVLCAVNLYELVFPVVQGRFSSYFSASAPATSAATSQRYIVVGVRGEPEFGRAVFWGRQQQDAKVLSLRALALSRAKFDAWLARRVNAGVIGAGFAHPAVFVALHQGPGGPNVFIGGPEDWKARVAQGSAQAQHEATPPPTDEAVADGTDDDNEPDVGSGPSSDDDDETASEPATAATAAHLPPPLVAQTVLKNNIITGYTASAEKRFTNYRLFASALTAPGTGPFRGWKFVYQGPAMASVTLVQDQLSAQLASVKNPRGLVNNIGWGGQSCLGGTKGAQIQCRTNRAQRDGCAYADLKVQPPQYRLWVQDECRLFFDAVCPADAQALWILKPSGGQHGAGMSVHQGCAQLQSDHGACALGDARKRFFIMPYLEPALLDGHKFDVRSYILVASLQPALLFYHDGFVRRATSAYSRTDLGDKAAHITNAHEQDAKDDHFWDFDRLSDYLAAHAGFPPRFMQTAFREHAKRVSEFVYFSAEPFMRKRRGKFQLFAVDWIVDARGGAHMLEVNSNPLVTAYPCKGFPETWTALMDLVLTVHTRPQDLREPLVPGRFSFQGWELVYNEQLPGPAYNACATFASEPAVPLAARHLPKTAAEVQSELAREERDDALIRDDLDRERAMVGGGRIEPWAPLEDGEAARRAVPWTPRAAAGEFNCTARQPGSTYDRLTCLLAHGTPDETPVHVLASGRPGPVVVVVAGMHGNEGAGVVAARHIAKYWTLQTGAVVVVERANARGVRVNSRVVPGAGTDLNRAFPPAHEPTAFMAKALWELMGAVRPHVLMDLHEGRGFFAASGVKDEVTRNVGSTVGTKGASKGSSIVASVEALPLAHTMVAPLNAAITDPEHRFLIISPPIEGGLAAKVAGAFGTRSLVLETTLLLPLEDRVRQHLVLVSTGLRALGVLQANFDFDAAGPPPEACVATRKGCGDDGAAVDAEATAVQTAVARDRQ